MACLPSAGRLRQWKGDSKTRPKDGVGEAFGSDIGRGAARDGGRIEHRPLRNHLEVALQIAGAGRRFDTAAANQDDVIAASPIDGVCGGRREEREEPMRLWRSGGGDRSLTRKRAIAVAARLGN